ncbi:MAG: riboflavin synthase, partial [Deltaproteobacteria bacterium]|nr:riboflavin synthase [Deltaproteobacteria bacterium]
RVDLSHASIGATTLGSSQAGRRVHLERALRLADRLGGHLVSGHVDGVAVLRDIRVRGDFLDLVVVPPRDQLPLLAPKGSVALDGVSLTINTVAGDSFHVAVIPHTQGLTTLGDWRPGRKINLESDLVAKYLHRLTEHREAPGKLADWLAGHDRGREER